MSRVWRIAGFEELKELGRGGQGRVVLARASESGGLVAIKYLTALSEDGRGALRREARMLGLVDHPHVVRLYRLVESETAAAIVMEAVDGVSLTRILSTHGTLTPEAALAVLKGSLLGLAAAHGIGVVHRDYKPGNVIVRADGLSKLIDFGVAVFEGAGDRSGTPRYMAPEQWAGRPASAATDVYAATCVFFECVTGAPPYPGPGLAELQAQHSTDSVPVEAAPGPLRPLLERGMAKDPVGRPSDAMAFVAELEAAALEAYGRDWEKRGVRALGVAAAALAVLFPVAVAGGGSGSAVVGATTAGKAGLLGSTTAKVAAAGTAVAVAGGAGGYALVRLPDPARPAPVAVSAVAYATPTHVVIRSPDGTVRQVGQVRPTEHIKDLRWTPDGRRIAWLSVPFRDEGSGPANAGVRVFQADATNGRTRSAPCGRESCNRLWIHQGKIYTSEDEVGDAELHIGRVSAVYEYPASGAERITHDPDRFARLPGATFERVFSDVSGGTALLVVGAKPGTSRMLYRVGPGRPPELVFAPKASEFLGDPSAVTPDGHSVAVIVGGPDSCTVAVVRISRGSPVRYPSPVPALLRTLWSGPDGTIHATFAPRLPGRTDCAEESVGRPLAFRLENGRWVKGASATEGDYTRSGWGAALTITGQHRIGENPVPIGVLRLRRAATTITVAEQVLTYALPPA